MNKPSLFDELSQGMKDWSDYNTGKMTLKIHAVTLKKILLVSDNTGYQASSATNTSKEKETDS